MYPSENSFPRPDFETVIRDHLAWLERKEFDARNAGIHVQANAYRYAAADLRGRLA